MSEFPATMIVKRSFAEVTIENPGDEKYKLLPGHRHGLRPGQAILVFNRAGMQLFVVYTVIDPQKEFTATRVEKLSLDFDQKLCTTHEQEVRFLMKSVTEDGEDCGEYWNQEGLGPVTAIFPLGEQI